MEPFKKKKNVFITIKHSLSDVQIRNTGNIIYKYTQIFKYSKKKKINN